MAGFFLAVWAMPGITAMKIVVAAHHYILLLIAFAVVWRWRSLEPELGMLSITIVGFAVFRSLVFSLTILSETRYLAPAMAWLDVLLVVVAINLLSGGKIFGANPDQEAGTN